jgi:putative membrane protein
MKVIVIEGKQARLNKFIDWLIYMVGYTLILILISIIFRNNFAVDDSYFGLWPFLASIIIYFLNKTVKPILFFLTLPITGITLGLFYPFINVLILKMADLILFNHFETRGIFVLFFAAVLISIMNFMLEKAIIEPLTRRGRE